MVEEKYTEQYLSRKISEFINLKHRCQRYWKRLIKESLMTAKDRDLEIISGNEPQIVSDSRINIFNLNDEIYDKNLLELSKNKFPGLYNKFNRFYSRYKTLKKELEEIRDYFS